MNDFTSSTSYPYEDNIPFNVVKVIEGIVGTFGNVLTIIAIIRFKKLQTGSNLLLGNLAFSDLISLLAVFLTVMLAFMKHIQYYDNWIHLCYFMLYCGFLGGNTNLCGICFTAFDRFLAVKFPIFYRNKVKFSTWFKILIISWVIFITKIILEAKFSISVSLEKKCTIDDTQAEIVYLLATALLFVIVSIITTTLYVQIAYWMRKRMKAINMGKENDKSRKQHQAQIKMTRVMAMVFGKLKI